MNNNLFGLVVCGGKSKRMGYDKGLIDYHGKPQRYHVYELLQPYCKDVFISCNPEQVDTIPDKYKVVSDLPRYRDTGPIGAILTAFDHYPDRNFLVIGCDYPLLCGKDIEGFIGFSDRSAPASFYNDAAALFEPLLAFYPASCAGILYEMFEKRIYTLQYYFKVQEALRYTDFDEAAVKSVDTAAQEKEARAALIRMRC